MLPTLGQVNNWRTCTSSASPAFLCHGQLLVDRSTSAKCAPSPPPLAPPQPGVPLRPLTGALPFTELTVVTSPHRWASLRPKPQIGFPTSASHSSPPPRPPRRRPPPESMAATATPVGEKFPLLWPSGLSRWLGQAKRLCGLSPLQQYPFLFSFQIMQIQF
jgi:hypothetical protein